MVQALYDAGYTVMGDVLLTLHGEAHSRRRMVEFSVFGRGFFRHYESVVFPATLAPVLALLLAKCFGWSSPCHSGTSPACMVR